MMINLNKSVVTKGSHNKAVPATVSALYFNDGELTIQFYEPTQKSGFDDCGNPITRIGKKRTQVIIKGTDIDAITKLVYGYE